MKFDPTKKTSRFKERALQDFRIALFDLLEQQALENITVNELCEYCNYPRSTFYNCFEDLYDLMDYAWSVVGEEIVDENYHELADTLHTEYLFNRMYDFVRLKEDRLDKIMRNNPLDGRMVSSMKSFMSRKNRELMQQCNLHRSSDIPREMLIEHYTNTIVMVLEWSFLRKDKITKENADEYIQYLLVSLEH